MTGKLLAILIVVCAVVAGVAMYYLQVYGYYYTVTPTPGRDVVLTDRQSGATVPISYDGFQAIDADSSPIRYRACFTTDLTPDQLAQQFEPAEKAEPLTAPACFDCYDAEALGTALENGTARAFIGVKNIQYGVDRVVAVTQDGRGFAWHVLNHCGEKAYDGTVVGEECPPRPES